MVCWSPHIRTGSWRMHYNALVNWLEVTCKMSKFATRRAFPIAGNELLAGMKSAPAEGADAPRPWQVARYVDRKNSVQVLKASLHLQRSVASWHPGWHVRPIQVVIRSRVTVVVWIKSPSLTFSSFQSTTNLVAQNFSFRASDVSAVDDEASQFSQILPPIMIILLVPVGKLCAIRADSEGQNSYEDNL